MSVVKIVILNWNGAAHLRRFLPSVVRTASPGVEIVVADNGSTDGSAALVEREFPSVTLLRLPENYGFAGGYNRALERLGGDYWVLLNSDVEPAEGWLEPLIAELDAQPDVAVVGPKLLSCAERDRFEYAGAAGGFIDWFGFPFCRGRILRTLEKDRGQYDDTRDVFWVSGAAFCCRAEVFRRMGGFDAGFFAHMEEIDLCWRMQLAGWRVRVVPRSRVWHLGRRHVAERFAAQTLPQLPQQPRDALQVRVARAACRGGCAAAPCGCRRSAGLSVERTMRTGRCGRLRLPRFSGAAR